MKRYLQNSSKILSLIFFFIIWEGVAFYIDNSLLFPRIGEIASSLKNILIEQSFIFILWNTLSRFFISIIISLVLSIILAVISYNYNFIQLILSPFIILTYICFLCKFLLTFFMFSLYIISIF